MNKKQFLKYCSNLNIELTNKQIENFDKYVELLKEWNNKFNLTSITDESDIYLKHFYDSLCLSKTNLLNNQWTLCDFGTGAGFPGIVLGIIYNNLNITLVESNQKKCMFLNEVIYKLKLNNIKVINDRIENFSKKNIETYDLVTCRAVSSLRILLETSVQLLKINGYFIPLKSKVIEELKESKGAMSKLNMNLVEVIEYNLPIENSYRSIPIIKKEKKTNKIYPREYNKIIKKPL